MTLQNESELRATLILDLRENEWTHGVDGLEIKRLKQNPNLSEIEEVDVNKQKQNESLEDEEIMVMLEKHPAEQHTDNSQDQFDFDNDSQGSDAESIKSIKESRIW